jgi:rhodanese-related sulfurtransferase
VRLTEVERIVAGFFKDRSALEAVTAQQLKQRLKSVVVLDVRPETEYESGHVPTARSIPITQLKRRLKELPRKREIIAYSRGSYCIFADQAVKLLRSRGYKAFRLADGFPGWKVRGFPIELTAPGGRRFGAR